MHSAPTYHRRVIDAELDELLSGVAALSLEGAKGVGKSATPAPGGSCVYECGRRAQLASYIERVIDRDIVELGAKVRNPSAAKRWMAAYAAATATTTTFTKIASAANPDSCPQPSRPP